MSSSRRTLLASAGALALGGCGFQLRGSDTLSFRSIALTGFAPRSPLADELKTRLQRSGVTIESNPAQAELVLQVLTDVRERSVAATTTAAQVRDLTLKLRFRFRTQTPAGRELTAPIELALARDMSYNETQALAKQHEANELYREMQADVVSQVMRRLAAVKV